MKRVLGIHNPPPPHWVGDGFPVRSIFSYPTQGRQLSPFLLLDMAGPAEFSPASRPRGVGEHPHRGFETVTIVYEGEVSHRDSTGRGGTIGPGDVQWMTAAGGILHEEFHSEAFTRSGGTMLMAQLWVNLSAGDKMSAPGYQAISARDIPEVALPEDAGVLRVIAGDYVGRRGPARTFTPMHVWDLRLAGGGARIALPLPPGWNTALVVLRGSVHLDDGRRADAGHLVLFDPAGADIEFVSAGDAIVLLLSGEPIDEPIAGYGPFVMNSEDEIRQAIADFNSGRFGQIAP